MTSIPADVTLEELRAETARREKRSDVTNTEAKLQALDDLLAGLEPLIDVARRAGVGRSGVNAAIDVAKTERKKTKERLEGLYRWQAHSDPESTFGSTSSSSSAASASSP